MRESLDAVQLIVGHIQKYFRCRKRIRKFVEGDKSVEPIDPIFKNARVELEKSKRYKGDSDQSISSGSPGIKAGEYIIRGVGPAYSLTKHIMEEIMLNSKVKKA